MYESTRSTFHGRMRNENPKTFLYSAYSRTTTAREHISKLKNQIFVFKEIIIEEIYRSENQFRSVECLFLSGTLNIKQNNITLKIQEKESRY